MIKDANWIKAKKDFNGVCPAFFKKVVVDKSIDKCEIEVTATGVYEVYVNEKRVSDYVLAPGWTNYEKRLQYQKYDITDYVKNGENLIEITVGNGWYLSRISQKKLKNMDISSPRMIAAVEIKYSSKEKEYVYSDEDWSVKQSKILFSDIYDGEVYDAEFEGMVCTAETVSADKDVLIPQEGEIICEQDRLAPTAELITPKGEWVIDFGQEITGYVEFCAKASKGEEVSLSFAEVLDKDGNFYNENYRSAKCIYNYKCTDGMQTYKTHTTFYGFRYIRVDKSPKNITKDAFTAIVVGSDIKKTGTLKTDNALADRLFRNIEWGQRGNFLDIPTDCPQRDERLGWTGDAQVFVKTAAYQYDVKRFFEKWLNDMASEQRNDGLVQKTIPDVYMTAHLDNTSPAWGDAAVICPWIIYEMYGDKSTLEKYFPMMEKWVEYVESVTAEENLWIGFENAYGDWLGLDAPSGSYVGSSDKDFVASAYYVHVLNLMKKAAHEIKSPKYEMYKSKYDAGRKAFMKRFPTCRTQTEYALVLRFNLTDNKAEFAEKLADMIHKNGDCLTTGFAGTPHLLFALSENGQLDTAYKLLLQTKYPSWLFSVNSGATTVWEHWDGIREDGSFWSTDMNSFNHYAYGSVAEWVYAVAAGIQIDEKGIEIRPHPNAELGNLSAEFMSRYGRVYTSWRYEDGVAVIDVEIPVSCTIVIDGVSTSYEKGKYNFVCKNTKR